MQKQTTAPYSRPHIADFESPREFVAAMIGYHKKTDPRFSILSATRGLRKVSPTLVTLILKGQRQLTLERADEFAKFLKLSAAEKSYLKVWLEQKDPNSTNHKKPETKNNRKEVSSHILSDWINVYVKDAFEIPAIQASPELLFRQLANLGSPKRIEKSLQFLLREGHLRKTLEGKIVPDTPLTVTDPQIPSQKIRNFHKGALGLAKSALDSHPAHERYANTLILTMDPEKYQELVQMIQEFAERLKDFAAHTSGSRLYQVLVNLSPTGGKFE